MSSSKRGLMVAPVVAAGFVLGGCTFSSDDLDEHASHARDLAAKAKEMAEEQRLDGKKADGDVARPHDEPHIDDPYVDKPYVDDPYVVDTPGEAAIGVGPIIGAPFPGPVARTYAERTPGYVLVVSCDGDGTCVRRMASGYGYGSYGGCYGAYGY